MFNDMYAKRAINSRTVFFLASDGYDTGTPEVLADGLRRLKKRCVASSGSIRSSAGPLRAGDPAMVAALPFIDHFAAAHTLASLAAVEGRSPLLVRASP